jgi:hypothetical protein
MKNTEKEIEEALYIAMDEEWKEVSRATYTHELFWYLFANRL